MTLAPPDPPRIPEITPLRRLVRRFHSVYRDAHSFEQDPGKRLGIQVDACYRTGGRPLRVARRNGKRTINCDPQTVPRRDGAGDDED